MPSIRLAVLDMAGTTVRDDGVVERAFASALAAMGVDPDPHAAYVRETMGQSKLAVFESILGDDQRAREASQRFEVAYERAVAAGEIGPIDGAETAIDRMRADGIRVCLTTGFSPATQLRLVDALGWRDRVDLALAPSVEWRGRPFPDLVLVAAIRMRVDDVREIAVAGDTEHDLLAGYRAGASVLAGVLTGARGASALRSAPHTHVLGSIAELPDVLGVQ